MTAVADGRRIFYARHLVQNGVRGTDTRAMAAGHDMRDRPDTALTAGCLIATEAGCRRTNLAAERFPFGGDLAGTELVVAAPGVFDELVARLGG
jgi:hypothetical protein